MSRSGRPGCGCARGEAGGDELLRQAEALAAALAESPDPRDRLVVSTRTVDSHVVAVLAKLGVTTRRAAAVRTRDLGVLDPEVR